MTSATPRVGTDGPGARARASGYSGDMSDQTPSEPTPGSVTPESVNPESVTPESVTPESVTPEAPAQWPAPPPGTPAQWPAAPVAAPAPGTPVPPPGTPAQWPAAPLAAPPPGVPAPAYYPPSSPTSTNAVIAFVLSIVSWAVCPIIPAIVALVLAAGAQKEIAAGQGRVQGGGLVTAAKIIAWINIGFWAALLVIGAFFLVLAAVASAGGV